jgi:hypothetical protein
LFSGWRAANIADNLGEHDERLNAQFSAAAGVSSKARFIVFCKCSESWRTGCRRLVRPSGPLAVCGPTHRRQCTPALPPRVSPLPLCCACRTAIARWVAQGRVSDSTARYRVLAVTRISCTGYDVKTGTSEWDETGFRVSIQDSKVAAHYGAASMLYEAGCNM